MSTVPDRKELLDLYRIAIDEYRFEVRLNWDRMQYYAVVNSGIIVVGTGLLREADSVPIALLTATIFLVGMVIATIGIVTIHRGRDYYQETVFKKTIYEELLGLNIVPGPLTNPKATLAIATTNGMQEVQDILAGRPKKTLWDRLLRNRIVSFFMWLLILLAAIDFAALVYASFQAVSLAITPLQREVLQPNETTTTICILTPSC